MIETKTNSEIGVRKFQVSTPCQQPGRLRQHLITRKKFPKISTKRVCLKSMAFSSKKKTFESIFYISFQIAMLIKVYNRISFLQKFIMTSRASRNDNSIPEQCLPRIQNVVGTVDLGCKLDLKQITWKGKATEYNPNRFAAVIMRLRNPKTTGLIFSSGKMVITGAKSQQDCKLASRKYAKIIQKMGFKVNYHDFKVQNVVASCDMKVPIHLQGLQKDRNQKQSKGQKGSEVQYEPQIFPGLVYRMKPPNPSMAFLIFVSGKIVITGAKSYEQIRQSYQKVYRLIYKFRKSSHNQPGST